MKIESLSVSPYEISLTNGQTRQGAVLHIQDEKGNSSYGDIAPLPKWSKETLRDCLLELEEKKHKILSTNWIDCSKLHLLPALSFGLESALLSLLIPLPKHTAQVSALFMGSPSDILNQAKLRQSEGFTSAKLKIGHLNFKQASFLIHQLKDLFYLRIDVNRAWNTKDSLRFFSKFPLTTFDYIEEPFQNPKDLALFPHPLAVDESFPKDLSFQDLETLPTLKALIYKPTIQGGMLHCLPLYAWSKLRGIDLVLSGSFESDLGLAHIASMAHRLALTSPIGIGTYHYLKKTLGIIPLRFSGSTVHIPSQF